MTRWTVAMVEERLQEAACTLRRLPPVKICGYFSAWPQILHDADDKRDWETDVIHRGPPSPQAISRMEETLEWFCWLKPDESHLIWMRANNTSWKTICWQMGCARNTAWRHWVYALAKIASRLYAEKHVRRTICK